MGVAMNVDHHVILLKSSKQVKEQEILKSQNSIMHLLPVSHCIDVNKGRGFLH